MSNTDTMKEVYLLAQEHCGLKVGDWVRVIRKAKNYEAGWDNCWVNDDIPFDVPYKIVILAKKHGIILDCGIYGQRAFPYFVLEKVERPAHQFKPFERVLVRDSNREIWRCNLFSHICNETFVCDSGMWIQCIPYEGNEHLVGTVGKPEE